MFMDFSNVEDKAVKGTARETVLAELVAFLSEKFGAEYITQTDSGTYAVAVGEKGNEVCVEVGVTAKDFVDRTTPKKGLVKAFDRKAAGEKYVAHCEEMAANKAARKATAEKNKARDEAKREAAKAKAKAEEESEG